MFISGYRARNRRQLANFTPHQGLAHSRKLYVEIIFGQVEVRSEHHDGTTIAPLKRKLVRFILPLDAVIIEQAAKLSFAIVVIVDISVRRAMSATAIGT